MSRYYTTPLFVFCTVGGIVTFLVVSSFTEDLALTVLCAAVATLLISITVPLSFYIADRKFLSLRREIKEPIVIDERVNYVVGDEIKQGFMLATKESLFVISTDNEKPVKLELKKNEIKKISVTDGVYMNIFVSYDKCIRIFAGNCDELLRKLRTEGFAK